MVMIQKMKEITEDEKKLKMLTPFLYQVGFKKAKPKKVSQ